MKRLAFAVILLIFAGLLLLGATHRTIHSKQVDPTGKYIAVCSYRTYLSFLPMAPGSSSAKACFVKIQNTTGENYGEIPVPMIQMAQVDWHSNGAEIKLVGEWDFTQKTCCYWSDYGNRKIYVRK